MLITKPADDRRNAGFLWPGPAGGGRSPAYDLNPVPTDMKPLTTAIDLEDGAASLKLALEVAAYFELGYRFSKTYTFYPCVSVSIRGPKNKLRKLTERERKQAIWPRMDTDTHGCGVPASSRSTGRRLEQNCMVMFWRNAILGRTQASLTEIAFQVNYGSVEAFTRAFASMDPLRSFRWSRFLAYPARAGTCHGRTYAPRAASRFSRADGGVTRVPPD